MTVIDNLSLYLQQDFVRYALIAGVLISLCAALLGVPLVLKRFSFIGDGLSHVAFGAMAVAAVTGISNEMFIVMPVTVIAAVILLATGRNAKLKGDASLAVISVAALGIGYLIMNVFSVSGNVSGDVCTGLFGSLSHLTLSKTDVIICVGVSLAVILIFVLFYNRIFAVTFDETFALATGTKAKFYNLLIAVVTAVVIVLAMNLVGSLLISALIVFPALSAMRVFRSFRQVVICSAIISVVCSFTGSIISLVASTPIGATIVVLDLLVFILFAVIGRKG
ncbi:MAG: metal ABC transporter permease [Ruminococcaceae bacterium]|nr:metal ABC transporter permease [Oscillospiraceae bacterium]MBR3596751.1 metal ABC transporter permease [Clostridia bacterium]